MHWTERRKAKANLGLALRARGWTLYGFHEDRSDPMTDYWAPASWDGVAEKRGYVVVVDISVGSSLLKRSGGRSTAKQSQGDDYDHVEVTLPWPSFQVCPPRKLWHVEKDGRVLDSGVGLGPCADCDRDKAAAAVNRIVDRIEAAIHHPEGNETPGAAATTNTDGVIIRRNLEKEGIEVVFSARPDETIRAGLKRLKFRWSRRQGLWYARYNASLWDRVHQLLDLDNVEPADPGTSEQNDILHVTDVYGRPHQISHRDHALGRTQIRLYCQTTNTLLADLPPSHPARQAQGGATTIHRDNIAATEAFQPDTIEDIVVEALELDAVIQASDSGFPKEIADRMNELRGIAFRLDPDVDLDAEIRRRRAYDVPKLVRQWKDLTRRLEHGHGMRSDSRAAATTKHAHLGQLAQSRDQVQDALRIAVRQAQERGEAIPVAIRAEPGLARILLDEPETETIPAAVLHGTGVGLHWPVPLHARKELQRRGWQPLYDEDEAGKTEAWLCPEGQDYSQVIAQVYALDPSDEGPLVRVFTWPRPAAIAEPGPPSRIVIRRAEIEWSPDGHLQARDLDSGAIYVPHSPESNAPHQLALF